MLMLSIKKILSKTKGIQEKKNQERGGGVYMNQHTIFIVKKKIVIRFKSLFVTMNRQSIPWYYFIFRYYLVFPCISFYSFIFL